MGPAYVVPDFKEFEYYGGWLPVLLYGCCFFSKQPRGGRAKNKKQDLQLLFSNIVLLSCVVLLAWWC
jgi:hypothetical protein